MNLTWQSIIVVVITLSLHLQRLFPPQTLFSLKLRANEIILTLTCLEVTSSFFLTTYKFPLKLLMLWQGYICWVECWASYEVSGFLFLHLINKYLLSSCHMKSILLDTVGVTKMPYRDLTIQPCWLFYLSSYSDYALFIPCAYLLCWALLSYDLGHCQFFLGSVSLPFSQTFKNIIIN